jgi:hypothetical protein
VTRFHVSVSRTHFGRYRGRRVSFSYFALHDMFLAVPRVSGPIFMFALPDFYGAVPWASGPVFIFYAPGLLWGDTKGVGSNFHVLRYRTRIELYRGRRVQFSCFALLDSFSAVSRAPVPVFDGTKGVGSCLHILRSRTHFRRNLGRRVPFACFALLNSFSTVSRMLDHVCMFCAFGHIFDVTEGVRSRFHVLFFRTSF